MALVFAPRAAGASPQGVAERRTALVIALVLAGGSSGCALSAGAAPAGAVPARSSFGAIQGGVGEGGVGAEEAIPYRILGPAAATLDPASIREAPGGSSEARGLVLEGSPRGIASAAARCPSDMALVDDRLCVDKWEASVVLLVGGREEPHSPYEPLDGVSTPYRAVSRPGVVPHGYVSGAQAETACRASGKRLCTAGEWEQACRGPQKTQYPYGPERRAQACNDDVRATHPVVEAARRLGVPAEATWTTGMNLPLVNQLPDSLARSGEHAACETPEGVYDLVGNLHEWIADADGTFRGGFYMDTTQNGEGCAYQTTAHDFDYHDYSTGFRCCAHADGIE